MPQPVRPSSSSRRARRSAPSCRNGVSSVLRLAQPAPRKALVGTQLAGWLTRAASALTPVASTAQARVRPSEFAPSQWLVGH